MTVVSGRLLAAEHAAVSRDSDRGLQLAYRDWARSICPGNWQGPAGDSWRPGRQCLLSTSTTPATLRGTMTLEMLFFDWGRLHATAVSLHWEPTLHTTHMSSSRLLHDHSLCTAWQTQNSRKSTALSTLPVASSLTIYPVLRLIMGLLLQKALHKVEGIKLREWDDAMTCAELKEKYTRAYWLKCAEDEAISLHHEQRSRGTVPSYGQALAMANLMEQMHLEVSCSIWSHSLTVNHWLWDSCCRALPLKGQ